MGEAQQEKVLERLEDERERRKQLPERSRLREAYIEKYYQPLHHEVYQLKPSYLDPNLRSICESLRNGAASAEKDLRAFVREKAPGRIYRFPIFTRDFCKLFQEEMQNFDGSCMPKSRPNSMNNYGILLKELGFYPGLLDPLLKDYLQPMSQVLFPDAAGGTLDHHRSFMVGYGDGKDRDLAYHYDDSEVTLNVCIGDRFEGGQLLFGGLESSSDGRLERYPVEHEVGVGILHRGIHRHEALPVEDGERYNLIMWCRSFEHRYKECPHCGRPGPEQSL